MKAIITGGAGFIGVNSALKMLNRGWKVAIFDNFSRRGTESNLAWLSKEAGNLARNLVVHRGDVRVQNDVDKFFALNSDAEVILHEAAQVAVTTSVADPREDFEINCVGTFNVLEGTRRLCDSNPAFIYASTNKVYGGMEDIEIVKDGSRYRYKDLPGGIPEDRLLDFHSPYGCSKGAADQYVRDYHRIYGLRSVVMRQSCIFGQRQFGMEDQGWVAWFTIATVLGKPITIYGDGCQVRDVLFVDDLVQAYFAAIEHIEEAKGRVYNIGGGPESTLSLLELIETLSELSGREIPLTFADWRPGDQPVYVSNIERAENELGWRPEVGVREGIERLYHWVLSNSRLFA
ncbi:MAG: GDP-mannose 4,6-dehydratase [Planctomycetes bacterium]|nr:GDP-mannose 4,6-dehydratase [Planctomycetota bacterium]